VVDECVPVFVERTDEMPDLGASVIDDMVTYFTDRQNRGFIGMLSC